MITVEHHKKILLLEINLYLNHLDKDTKIKNDESKQDFEQYLKQLKSALDTYKDSREVKKLRYEVYSKGQPLLPELSRQLFQPQKTIREQETKTPNGRDFNVAILKYEQDLKSLYIDDCLKLQPDVVTYKWTRASVSPTIPKASAQPTPNTTEVSYKKPSLTD